MYRILTDTSANLNGSLLEQNGVAEIPFSFYVNEEEHRCLDVEGFDSRAFYDAMRQGAKVQTSQVPPLLYEQTMRPILEKGQDVLFIGMSSGISGSFQSAWTASRQLQSEFPERKIRLVDTLGASLGEGLLVLQAARWQQEGVTLEESAARLEALRGRMCQVFTVEDLRYLRATGRLSNAKAAIGTILNIKPLLKGDPQGKIVSFARIHGRKGSIRALAEKIVALSGSRSRIVHRAARPDDARRRIPDISAARRELDWTPRTPLAEGLRRTISYAEKELTDKVYTELTWAEMN